MEYVTFDYIMEVKDKLKPFLVFIFVPCIAWWYNFIIGFFKKD